MTRVAVVVLNWNGIEDTEECIKSLLYQSYKDMSIIVIDNGSVDHSLTTLRKLEEKHAQITVIANSKNLGFAGGVNTGIRYALTHDYELVALFNNDAVADRDWLKQLVAAYDSTDADIITSLLLHRDKKTIDSTGDFYSLWGMAFPRSRDEKYLKDKVPESGYVFSGSGGASLYSTKLFKEIGLFDEVFFAYFEDVDVSFRAQLSGHKVYYTNKAIAYHTQGGTSSKISGFSIYQTFKNLPLLYIKNVPLSMLFRIGWRLALLYWLMFFKNILKGNGKAVFKGWIVSIWYFFTSALPQRFAIQGSKAVTDGYISSIIYSDLPPGQKSMRALRRKVLGR